MNASGSPTEGAVGISGDISSCESYLEVRRLDVGALRDTARMTRPFLSWFAAPSPREEAHEAHLAAEAGKTVEAERHYAQEIMRTVFRSFLLGAFGFVVQVGFVAISSVSETANGPRLDYARLDSGTAGAAIAVLLPLGLALQVLLRLPRDRETVGASDAAAQRQFWGKFASLVAVGAAFVLVGSLVDSFAISFATKLGDFVGLLGLPLGAGLVLVIAADASVVADLESKRLDLMRAGQAQTAKELRESMSRLRTDTTRQSAKKRYARQGLTIGITITTLAAMVAWVLIPVPVVIFMFACTSLIVTGFTVSVFPGVAVAIVRGRILDAILQIMPALLIAVSMSSASIAAAYAYAYGASPIAALPRAILFGVLMNAPGMATIAFLAWRPLSWQPAPLLSVARSKLADQLARLERAETERNKPELWKSIAKGALALSFIPPLALLLAGAATWHRMPSGSSSPRLIRAAWIAPLAVSVFELAAMIFWLPVLVGA